MLIYVNMNIYNDDDNDVNKEINNSCRAADWDLQGEGEVVRGKQIVRLLF